MANALKNLKAGLEADIKYMAQNNFMDVNESMINEAYTCLRLIKVGKNTFTPITWIEAWKLYGLHNYSKINAYLETQLQPKQKTLINISRSHPLQEKIDSLQAYIAPAPALLKRAEASISEAFANEYAGQACA